MLLGDYFAPTLRPKIGFRQIFFGFMIAKCEKYNHFFIHVIKVLHFGTGLGGTTFWVGCRHKVVAEKLLLGLFLIGWTFFLMPSTF